MEELLTVIRSRTTPEIVFGCVVLLLTWFISPRINDWWANRKDKRDLYKRLAAKRGVCNFATPELEADLSMVQLTYTARSKRDIAVNRAYQSYIRNSGSSLSPTFFISLLDAMADACGYNRAVHYDNARTSNQTVVELENRRRGIYAEKARLDQIEFEQQERNAAEQRKAILDAFASDPESRAKIKAIVSDDDASHQG